MYDDDDVDDVYDDYDDDDDEKAWIVIEQPKLKIATVCGRYRGDLSVDIDDNTRYTADTKIQTSKYFGRLKICKFEIMWHTLSQKSFGLQDLDYSCEVFHMYTNIWR